MIDNLLLFGEETDTVETGGTGEAAIPGLYRFKIEESVRLEILDKIVLKGNWFTGTRESVSVTRLNQKMVFGRTGLENEFINFQHGGISGATALFNYLHACATALYPHMEEREFEFDQMISNFYIEGDTVKDHVDLLRFHDGILILNLTGHAILTFKHVSFGSSSDVVDENGQEWRKGVELWEGDCLFLRGPARYDWSHGIRKIECKERISLTFRRLIVE